MHKSLPYSWLDYSRVNTHTHLTAVRSRYRTSIPRMLDMLVMLDTLLASLEIPFVHYHTGPCLLTIATILACYIIHSFCLFLNFIKWNHTVYTFFVSGFFCSTSCHKIKYIYFINYVWIDFKKDFKNRRNLEKPTWYSKNIERNKPKLLYLFLSRS